MKDVLAAMLDWLVRIFLHLFDELEKDGVSLEIYQNSILSRSFCRKGDLSKKLIGVNYGNAKSAELSAEEVLFMVGNDLLSDKVAGGILLPNQRHLRPETFIKELSDWLLVNGTEIKINMEVTAINVKK